MEGLTRGQQRKPGSRVWFNVDLTRSGNLGFPLSLILFCLFRPGLISLLNLLTHSHSKYFPFICRNRKQSK